MGRAGVGGAGVGLRMCEAKNSTQEVVGAGTRADSVTRAVAGADAAARRLERLWANLGIFGSIGVHSGVVPAILVQRINVVMHWSNGRRKETAEQVGISVADGANRAAPALIGNENRFWLADEFSR